MISNNDIKHMTPLNIIDEKEKFFSVDDYNPWFTYENVIDESQLTAWGLPKSNFVEHAKDFISNQQTLRVFTGKHISEEDIVHAVSEFNIKYKVEFPIEIVFSKNLLVKCKVTSSAIYFHQPTTYTADQFAGIYRHELETHLLRQLNHKKQPWNSHQTPELDIRRTEEGLANLHTYLFRDNKILLKSYITYYAVFLAQLMGFREMFNQLKKLGLSDNRAWHLCLRTKRGLSDTVRPGGLSRDICYFEGTVLVWQWIMCPENNPKDLYLGRISLNQVNELNKKSDTISSLYPSFMDNMTEYRTHIAEIGDINHFSRLISP